MVKFILSYRNDNFRILIFTLVIIDFQKSKSDDLSFRKIIIENYT